MAYQINGIFPGELYPNETVAGCVDIFYNVWPNPEETIALIETENSNDLCEIEWLPATTGSAENNFKRTNLNIGITYAAQKFNNLVAQNIHNQMYLTIMAATIPYAQKHDIQELHHDDGYNILKYSENQEYQKHYDGSTRTGRCVSVIIYLNDNYDGGELEFVNFNTTIKPKAGMMLIFPSNYAYSHIAHPVKSGEKYALVTWLKDRMI